MKKDWYAIYTRSRSEKKLFLDIEQQGIECFLPLKKELKEWSDRKKWVESPLFTSYVFVFVDLDGYQKAIRSNYAVKYVTFEGKAVKIPEEQIQALKLFVEEENANLQVCNNNLQKGEKVEVLAGPFKGVEGEVIEVRGKRRLLIRMSMIGQCVSVEIDTEELRKRKD